MNAAFTCQSNGNLYPARQLTPAEHQQLLVIVHRLACTEGLSRRQIRRRLVDFGVLRSVGAISQYLSRFECDACATTPAEPVAESSARPEVMAWQ